MNSLEKLIVEIVTEKQGMKATELVTEAVLRRHHHASSEDLIGAINKLVEKGELVEVEYVLPQMDWRIKSFLLPKGTEVQVKSGPVPSEIA